MNRNILQTIVRQAEAFAGPGEVASDADLLARRAGNVAVTRLARLIL